MSSGPPPTPLRSGTLTGDEALEYAADWLSGPATLYAVVFIVAMVIFALLARANKRVPRQKRRMKLQLQYAYLALCCILRFSGIVWFLTAEDSNQSDTEMEFKAVLTWWLGHLMNPPLFEVIAISWLEAIMQIKQMSGKRKGLRKRTKITLLILNAVVAVCYFVLVGETCFDGDCYAPYMLAVVTGCMGLCLAGLGLHLHRTVSNMQTNAAAASKAADAALRRLLVGSIAFVVLFSGQCSAIILYNQADRSSEAAFQVFALMYWLELLLYIGVIGVTWGGVRGHLRAGTAVVASQAVIRPNRAAVAYSRATVTVTSRASVPVSGSAPTKTGLPETSPPPNVPLPADAASDPPHRERKAEG